MDNGQIAQAFEELAILSEMKGEVVFKVRAYQRAARTIDQLPISLESAVNDGVDLKTIPGVGSAISSKIQELVTTGSMQTYEKLKAELPPGVLTLMNVPGIGPKTAMLVATELGTSTVEEMESAILAGRLSALPRMGEKTAENILRHIRSLRSKDGRTPIGQALPIAESIIDSLRHACPGIRQMEYAGSLRRWQETIGDIDIMGTAPDAVPVIDALASLSSVQQLLVKGPKKCSVVVDPGIQVDLRIVEDDSYGALIQYFTGSQQHNVRLREYAVQRGLSLNEYGITMLKTGELEKFPDETSFYGRLGLPFIPPEIREGMWELDLASRDALPRFLELSDIRGDLHVHSNWSDGRDSIEDMINSLSAKGYQYMALTDHSAGLGVANGLSVERLRQQRTVLDSMQQGCSLKLFHGSEVDIRADGSLDYPDDMLAELDVVIASVHSAMGQTSEKMTARIISAMHNPHVTAIGHPTCRILGSRDPVEADMEALLQAAAKTGTAMEINASPWRLDLRDTHITRARELGVPLIINTDSHATEEPDGMRFGVAIARRGWCEPHHILNTMPLDRFQAFLSTPKPQRMRVFAGLD